MINNKTITLVAVSTDKPISTIKALEKSIELFPFFEKHLLLSSYDSIKNNIEIKKVSISSYTEYNKFMIENINSYINTDFALVIQDDGYIINPSCWSDSFLDFDYIGAPWPWHGVCGNGGFSLRSKKLLELSSRLKYNSAHHEYECCPEDAFICQKEFNRQYFLDNGIKFADIFTAARFSYENPIPYLPQHTIKNSFGFHGKFNLSKI